MNFGFNGKVQKNSISLFDANGAEFALPGAKDQSSPKQETPSESVKDSCSVRRLWLSLDIVSFCGCWLFRCFQFKVIFFLEKGWWKGRERERES